jgi:hypothetical protein
MCYPCRRVEKKGWRTASAAGRRFGCNEKRGFGKCGIPERREQNSRERAYGILNIITNDGLANTRVAKDTKVHDAPIYIGVEEGDLVPDVSRDTRKDQEHESSKAAE